MKLFLLCIKIFAARILDVSLGTIKTVFIIKEKKLISTIIAFIEVFIWFEVARSAINTDINSIFIPISYSLGYASGTFIGSYISSHYIKGHLNINIISSKITKKHINILKENGYGVSVINTIDHKKLIIIEINKKYLKKLQDLITAFDKKAFMIINETKIVHNGFIK